MYILASVGKVLTGTLQSSIALNACLSGRGRPSGDEASAGLLPSDQHEQEHHLSAAYSSSSSLLVAAGVHHIVLRRQVVAAEWEALPTMR